MDTRQNDIDHLRTLAIFHYVVAGITGLFSLFPLIHLTIGILIVSGGLSNLDKAVTPNFSSDISIEDFSESGTGEPIADNPNPFPNPVIVSRNAGPPAIFGWFFIIPALIFITMGMSLAVCIGFAGLKLGRQQSHTFCMVMAALLCAIFPFGTILGVLTIIALQKESVKQVFEESQTVKTGPEKELETYLSKSTEDR